MKIWIILSWLVLLLSRLLGLIFIFRFSDYGLDNIMGMLNLSVGILILIWGDMISRNIEED